MNVENENRYLLYLCTYPVKRLLIWFDRLNVFLSLLPTYRLGCYFNFCDYGVSYNIFLECVRCGFYWIICYCFFFQYKRQFWFWCNLLLDLAVCIIRPIDLLAFYYYRAFYQDLACVFPIVHLTLQFLLNY